MKIKNFKQLNQDQNRKRALEITEAGLQAIDTKKVIQNNVYLKNERLHIKDNSIKIKDFKRLFVVGIGKCSLDACFELENILGDLIESGIAVDISEKKKLKKIKLCPGTHPFPSKQNVECTKKVISLLKQAEKEDLVIFVISGGGSTLLCQPTDYNYKKEVEILKTLFDEGATIQEINTIRKHTSTARGGFLAKYAYPAKSFSLIFSDVPGDDLSFIASGPTVKDSTTINDAKKTLNKYNIFEKTKIKDFKLTETPKQDKYFKKVKNLLLVSNKFALNAIKEKAEEFDYKTQIITTTLTGEAKDIGKKIVEKLESEKPKTVLLYGGETTVTKNNKAKGEGGRNQELVLSALRFIGPEETVISIASDGRDNTDFAGAIADKLTQKHAKKIRIEKYLDQNNSFNFFKKTGDYIKTNNTGSNVSDLIITIKD